ncbi:hypothetical protein Back2_20270 [Nocardioides baekrokdamisoli]|uniref:Uncharacterized protein n=1 Tax=Nocardioides baekrokdamisoli TaxID=1804624 RepID=A0A3G9IFC9_9ACTN|nr:hypothetical protein Back2_20270 [Nocardioides baekrokdamisoli]
MTVHLRGFGGAYDPVKHRTEMNGEPMTHQEVQIGVGAAEHLAVTNHAGDATFVLPSAVAAADVHSCGIARLVSASKHAQTFDANCYFP